MSTLPLATSPNQEYFRSEPELEFVLNLRLAGRTYQEIADKYAEEFPDKGLPDDGTVARFFANHPERFKPLLDRIKPGLPLAYVRARLAVLSDSVYGIKKEISRRLPTVDNEHMGGMASLIDKLIVGLREIAVQCGDTLVSQLPQGSGDRPAVFQSVYVEKLVNQTLVVSDEQAKKQGGAKEVGGELLSPQSAISDADCSSPAA